MDWSTIVVAALALVGSLVGTYASNKKAAAVTTFQIVELQKKVEKHNGLVEKTYMLERDYSVLDEKVKVANNRISDLERNEHQRDG